MSKLQTVKIVAKGETFAVVTPEGYVERGDISDYRLAREIAERIDARNIYDLANGGDSLETV